MSKVAVLVEIQVDDVKLALNNAKRLKAGQQIKAGRDILDNVIHDSFRMVEEVTSVEVVTIEEAKDDATASQPV